jgi:hypothetical protein
VEIARDGGGTVVSQRARDEGSPTPRGLALGLPAHAGGLPVLQAVYLRHVDGRTGVHTREFTHTVTAWAAQPLTTPDGHEMRVPPTVAWLVQDNDGAPLLDVVARTHGDFTYGLGAGYAGSCRFTGTYRGHPVEGTSYMEWITRRGVPGVE